MGIVVIGGGPHPQNVKVVSDTHGVKILNEDGSVFASGFTDEADAHRYLEAIKHDPSGPEVNQES